MTELIVIVITILWPVIKIAAVIAAVYFVGRFALSLANPKTRTEHLSRVKEAFSKSVLIYWFGAIGAIVILMILIKLASSLFSGSGDP